MTVYVGTSGWQYADWWGRFYPKDVPKREWLAYFSERFPTVEVNNTFYSLPSEETFVDWRKGSAEGFLFTLKASRYITHMKRLKDPRDPVRTFWTPARRLARKLGAVLFQLPPNFEANPERVEGFLRALPKGVRPAFEFRHESWGTDEVHEVLDRHGAALVLADSPGARVPPVVTGGWSYVRFHKGREDAFDYKRDKLRRWADKIAALEAEDVYVYFNNDPGGAAVRDAATLSELLADRSDLDVRGPRLD